jgi:hypothetical protein
LKRVARVGLLSLIAIVQVLTIVSVHAGHVGYEEMREAVYCLQDEIQELYRERNILIDYGPTPPNPFAPPFALALLSSFLTVVLLIDQVHHRNVENAPRASTASKHPESSSA